MSSHRVALVLSILSLTACPGTTDDGGGDGSDTTGSSGITSMSTTTTTSATATTTSTSDGTSADTGTADGSDSGTSATTSESASASTDGSTDATGGGGGVTCDGDDTLQCTNGVDDDGDGKIDLDDPECTGPCDDDEGSFQTGLPGDNMDCKQDCFFDGNSGQGDDGCIWDITCDPMNPGEFINCEYTDGQNCNNNPPNQDPDCIMFCEQFVPPGCDCFGCCEVCDEMGMCVNIFIGGADDCSLDMLENCTMCEPQIDTCGNPCEPEMCEICFGQQEPPEGCGPNECDNGLPCTDHPDCPTDFYCLLGCCYPPPPG